MTGAPAAAHAFRTCGTRVDALNLDEAVTEVVAAATERRACAVHLCNAYTLSLTRRDAGYATTVDAGDLNVMDGMPLVWLARRLGFTNCTERVYGPDLMLEVMARGRDAGLRHYLYGGSPAVAETLPAALERRLPGLVIAGSESPPYRDLTADEEDEVAQRFAAADAHIVWVGLGTPKQDQFVARFRDRFAGPLVAVGAAFDFHAGVKRQAPLWLRERGLEWAYRLATEPRRLWRRYLVGNLVFVAGVMRGASVVTGPGDGGTGTRSQSPPELHQRGA